MKAYPIFCKSESFIQVENSKPTLPNKPELPPPPKLIKKNWFEKLILFTDEPQDQVINAKRTQRYTEELIVYEQELAKYKIRVSEILTDTNIKIFHLAKKKEALGNTFFASTSARDTLKGRYEDLFFPYLKKKFGDLIFTNLEFSLPNGNAFVPDFSYVNKRTGLCIDIEIDEPYTIESKKPIHFIGEDDYRNSYFSSKGWFVIRFAEIQIANHPVDCCNYIEECIESIISGNMQPEFRFKVEQWDYSKAQEMAMSNYRNHY